MNAAFWKAAAERAIKTFAQALLALLGTGSVGITSLDWPQLLSVSGTAALASVLTSLASLSSITPAAAAVVSEVPAPDAKAGWLPPVSADVTAPASTFPVAKVEAAAAAAAASVDPAPLAAVEPAPVAPVFEAPAAPVA